MTSRREFLKTVAAGNLVLLNLRDAKSGISGGEYFGLNEFVENHPDAVFVLRTGVDVKTNSIAITKTGYDLGKTLFVPRSGPEKAYPLSAIVGIKPNITAWAWDRPPAELTMGIQTDPFFVEGVIGSLTDLSVPAANISIRDANFVASQQDGKWYSDLAARTGINLRDLPPIGGGITPAEIQWVDVPNGVWYRRIPYLWPYNSPGSCLINIAKFKSHGMGMTLCSKNIHGTNARPYVAHCTAWGSAIQGVNPSDLQTNAFSTILANYTGHKAAIPRWKTLDGDSGARSAGGLWMETHTARCLDNNSAVQPIINIIEGVYGREGGFVSGPGAGGFGIDIMTNLVIFGKNARHVDIIGVYLAGHEPGNFGLFHIACERGLSHYLNPGDVPLYEWSLGGTATPRALQEFQRTPIRTVYLPQPGENQYHLVNQQFDYTATSVTQHQSHPDIPDAIAVSQNYPNPFNPSTSIQYHLPASGNVRLEVFDVRGEVVDVLVEGAQSAGDHLVVWRTEGRSSGTYFYRLMFGGMSKTRSMLFLR